ncbi:hypothetical protein M0805_005102 [Coniferiporia weirii]|nr:hypothetical protein M0805_005102 [Coniferiporia weirii]
MSESPLLDLTDLVRLPENSVRVDDPEEELFLLYTRLSTQAAQDGTHAFTGLGSIDSKQDTLTVFFDLPPPAEQIQQIDPAEIAGPSSKHHVRRAKTKRKTENRTLEIELLQDKTTLRSKKGDTGSVLWRVSVALGQALLRELGSDSATSLFKPDRLKECSVLELGAGTGLLSIILAPWVRYYTATDLDYLVPLIRKNITANLPSVKHALMPPRHHSSIRHRPSAKHPVPVPAPTLESVVAVETLDWLQLQRTAPQTRSSLFRLTHADPPDVIIIADCVYNPTLLPALVATLDHFARPGHTRVVVAVELRAEDVIRGFLELWTGLGGWEIWRVGGRKYNDDYEPSWLGVNFAIWVGWKNA